jgi:dUTP pyrophosphatase
MPERVQIRFKRLSDKATPPRVMQLGDAAADLCSSADLVIPARGRAVVPTDLVIELPPGFKGRIYPRSGLAARHGIDVGAGLIDEAYRGPVGVLLFNHSDEDFAIRAGDRIAQLGVERYVRPEFTEAADLTETSRSSGWGSTGVR